MERLRGVPARGVRAGPPHWRGPRPRPHRPRFRRARTGGCPRFERQCRLCRRRPRAGDRVPGERWTAQTEAGIPPGHPRSFPPSPQPVSVRDPPRPPQVAHRTVGAYGARPPCGNAKGRGAEIKGRPRPGPGSRPDPREVPRRPPACLSARSAAPSTGAYRTVGAYGARPPCGNAKGRGAKIKGRPRPGPGSCPDPREVSRRSLSPSRCEIRRALHRCPPHRGGLRGLGPRTEMRKGEGPRSKISAHLSHDLERATGIEPA